MADGVSWSLALLALCGAYLALHLLLDPARYAVRILQRAAIGYLVLWTLNLVGIAAGYHLPLNPITAAVAGVLGLPGLAAIAVLQWLSV